MPVRIDPHEPLGSLGLVMTRQRFAIADSARLVAMLSEAAARIDHGIELRQAQRATNWENGRRRRARRHTGKESGTKMARARVGKRAG